MKPHGAQPPFLHSFAYHWQRARDQRPVHRYVVETGNFKPGGSQGPSQSQCDRTILMKPGGPSGGWLDSGRSSTQGAASRLRRARPVPGPPLALARPPTAFGCRAPRAVAAL